jgi:anti-sigma-K factor RskA
MSDETNMGGKSEDDRVLAAEYVLGLLPVAEHPSVAARIASEPAMRDEERLWRLRLQSLDRQFEEVAAPAAALPKVESRLFGDTRQTGLSGFWNSLAVWRTLAAAGVAVAAIAIGFNVLTPRVDPKLFAEQLVAALQDQGQGVSFVALYDPLSGSVRLTALSGAQVPDKDYELWAIEGSQAPVSMGVVQVDKHQNVRISPQVAAQFGAGTVLAVTLEQKGGSPTGQPQGAVVAMGTATLI